jgi:hypothetical protein
LRQNFGFGGEGTKLGSLLISGSGGGGGGSLLERKVLAISKVSTHVKRTV